MFDTEHGYAIYVSDTELANKTIYEFMYDKTAQKFVLHRPRPDKDRPNFVNVAIDVFEDMVRPFESYKLLELFKPMFKFRKYHNQIKREIINYFCRNKTILDLGIGRGGDIDKYKKVATNKVFGVEPNATNYGELIERFPEYIDTGKDTFVELIKTTAQNTAQIVEKVGVEGVDVVASFFSLSFFFFPGKPDDLQKLVQTIYQKLKEGRHFIGENH